VSQKAKEGNPVGNQEMYSLHLSNHHLYLRKLVSHLVSQNISITKGSGDDEGDDPVDGAEGVPEELALLGGDLGPVEDFLADFDVDCLDC
jgi:hypothetical protein